MVLNDLAFQIWQICITYNAYLSSAHIPGAHNLLADIASREFHDMNKRYLNTYSKILSLDSENQISICLQIKS